MSLRYVVKTFSEILISVVQSVSDVEELRSCL